MKKGKFEGLGDITIRKVENGFILQNHHRDCSSYIENIMVLEHPDNRYLGASIKHFMETGEAIDPDEFATWSTATDSGKIRLRQE